MRVKAEVMCELLDKDSRIVKVLRFESRSFVKNFMNMLYAILCKTTSPAKDLDGNNTQWVGAAENKTGHWCHYNFKIILDEGRDDAGIIVGSGSTAVTPDDYRLESKIPHGDGDNQLHYYETQLLDPAVADGEAEVKVRRAFINYGSVPVTVSEVGLVNNPVHYYEDVHSMPGPRLLARDVLSSPVTLDPGCSLHVTYRIYVGV